MAGHVPPSLRGGGIIRYTVELARALPTVEVGQVVEVLTDDPAARHDVPAWCRMRGQEHLGASAQGQLVRRLS